MKDEPARFTKMVIRTEGGRVRVMWCNVRNIVKDEPVDVLEKTYPSLDTAIPTIMAWYEAKHG